MEFWVLDLLRSAFDKDGYADFDVVGERALGSADVCPHCSTQLGPKPWNPPYSIRVNGKKTGDICSSGHGREFLVSKRFLEAWIEAGLEGLEVLGDDLDFSTPNRNLPTPSGLKLVRFGHSLTRLDHEESGMVVHKLVGCEICDVSQISRLQRVRVIAETWDGRDIFAPSGLYGSVLVTRRASDVVSSNEFSNVHLVHQDDYTRHRDFA